MFFFLQEKNNTDRVSFYTPQIISDMITQSLCDDLDDSNIIIGRDRHSGARLPNDENKSLLNILVSVSTENSSKSYSEILYSHKKHARYAHMLTDSLLDFGKIVTFEHTVRRPKLTTLPDTTKKGKTKVREVIGKESLESTPYIYIYPFNIYSPHLLDYLRHSQMLTNCLSLIVQEIDV